MHELFNISNNVQTNITPLVGLLQWSSNINELGERLDFDIAYNDDRYFPKNPVDIGNLIILRNQGEIFRGIVITENKAGKDPITYTCFDYAFYLNKSKGIYQFNKVKGNKAIESILNDFNVPIGSIAPINVAISKIYNDKYISDIIKDILDIAQKETGIKYRMEMRLGKLYIEKQTDLIIKATFKLASNIAPNNVTDAIFNPTKRRTIEDMKNSIKIITTNNDKTKIVTEAKDNGLINKYGLLQEVKSIDKKDIAQAKNIAQNMLKDLGKIFEENNIEVPGDDSVRAGRILEVNEQVTGMKGNYLITDVIHTVKNGIHRMKLGLGVI
ncbi:hypothetical protein FQB35_04600 [Crassaminicella thermophila]|uniref:YqbQ/XkdQ domain-containing protein n=1 Tax=Crassaminicella thermophila TaxID=2599308 RepID=A0A5C0SC55_CRATE|nr:hypothetical protein [Crassaminicella thermophila]QEK11700.1 hypothetical protein FQB35_04600 [Crassaminicella thermophila]